MARWLIRDATRADLADVIELWGRAGSVPTPTDDGGSLVALVEHDAYALFVAESADAIVGSVIGAWDGWRASFYRLAVLPEHRRAGLATELVRAAEARLELEARSG